MARRGNSNVLVEPTERSDIKWFAFPIIGYLLVFFLCWLGVSLLSSNIIIGAIVSLVICAGFYFVTDFLEKAKTNHANETPYWIAFVLIAITSTFIGYHYLHVFHSPESSFMNYKESELKSKVSLFNQYNTFVNSYSLLGNCDMTTINSSKLDIQEEYEYYNNNLSYLNNPFKYLMSLGKTNEERTLEQIKETLNRNIQTYNSLNKGDCQYNAGINEETATRVPVGNSDDIADSIANANWLWIIGLLLISSFLLLVPYFITKKGKVILQTR